MPATNVDFEQINLPQNEMLLGTGAGAVSTLVGFGPRIVNQLLNVPDNLTAFIRDTVFNLDAQLCINNNSEVVFI